MERILNKDPVRKIAEKKERRGEGRKEVEERSREKKEVKR